MKKRRKNGEISISPNNLIVHPCAKPLSKTRKIVFISSVIAFLIGVIFVIACDKNFILLTEVTYTDFIIPITAISFWIAFLTIIEVLLSKVLRKIKNEEAIEEMLAREEMENY